MLTCPDCGTIGHKVRRVTLEHLLREPWRSEIGDGQYYVCAARGCPVVYFSDAAQVMDEASLSVPFGLKGNSQPRPVCYCFSHTVEDIHDEIRRTGRSTVVERIKADMRGAGCRCEHTNPLGACCLNSVEAMVAEGLRLIGREQDAAGKPAHSGTPDCCAALGAGQSGAVSPDRRTALVAGGSVLAAMLSSACCWLPLLLIALGASATGLAGSVEAYRPFFIAGAVGLLGAGFYMSYFRGEKCAPGGACVGSGRKLRCANRAMLWLSSVLVAAFALFPNYVGALVGAPPAVIADAGPLAAAEFRIEGMTCEACAATLRGVLAKLPGVVIAEVDLSTKSAVVRYKPDRPVPRERVVDAVKAAGYTARVAGE